MHKLKLILILTVTVGLVTAIAFLPQAAAVMQDTAIHGEVKYGDMQTVELHFGTEADREPVDIPTFEKLGMMRQPLYIISDEKASMTQEEVIAAIDTGLAPYYDVGLIVSDWSEAKPSLTPYLAYGEGSNYCIFWEVVLWGKCDNVYYFLSLYIDDETGKIITIDYMVDDAIIFDIADQAYYMTQFTEIYFDSLELSTSADHLNSEQLVEDISLDLPGRTALRYTFGDAVYGEVSIEFYIHESGFYVQIPLLETDV